MKQEHKPAVAEAVFAVAVVVDAALFSARDRLASTEYDGWLEDVHWYWSRVSPDNVLSRMSWQDDFPSEVFPE